MSSLFLASQVSNCHFYLQVNRARLFYPTVVIILLVILIASRIATLGIGTQILDASIGIAGIVIARFRKLFVILWSYWPRFCFLHQLYKIAQSCAGLCGESLVLHFALRSMAFGYACKDCMGLLCSARRSSPSNCSNASTKRPCWLSQLKNLAAVVFPVLSALFASFLAEIKALSLGTMAWMKTGLSC